MEAMCVSWRSIISSPIILANIIIDCLGRRLGPKLLGRGDNSGQRLVKDFYKVFNQVSTEEIPDGLKLPDSFSQLIYEMRNKKHSTKEKEW
ncbi:hypothetical protein RHGRI_032023 [Rhododendron griersonianum]|uniref:Uncharacterized protein n=1 Tax=Rhododendron griersonianum TaxID=479676 RepID=A0AAV6IA45_9ERIC|nr:hypothetical protein RHGRI_032023 [Rhododendron griersonianum]